MKRIDEDTIQLTQCEINDLVWFIRNTLDRDWDHYTYHVVVEKTTREEGMRRMNPAMYDMAQAMGIL